MTDFTLRRITEADEAAVRLPNQPFKLFGHFIVTRDEAGWQHHEVLDAHVREQTFPEENYQLADIDAKGFAIGAFAGDECVALATFENRWTKYTYLADLKVNVPQRRLGLAHQLMDFARPFAQAAGARGFCTVAQGSNLAANRFYLNYGFHIGGFNTNDYFHTRARGETDIYYYLDF
ncbi:GNAT family N-acetyltransferase [Lacticaseibacillus yichunensis]|uniref:GNAT family N-acetyltransferase n=1 Tax=Lacticaseibacillus yichunensis TaxID=2486015 RepID=A0ABW4CKR6_9LACO|nr:GNAT family N-acetyltransferase [Lacticaseibacillus yichunensis]